MYIRSTLYSLSIIFGIGYSSCNAPLVYTDDTSQEGVIKRTLKLVQSPDVSVDVGGCTIAQPSILMLLAAAIRQTPTHLLTDPFLRLVKQLDAEGCPLESTAIVGDVYIHPEYRGKQFAYILLRTLFNHTLPASPSISRLVIQPGPFEYVNDKQASLVDTPDYHQKIDRLIALYQRCGFILHASRAFLYAYNPVYCDYLIDAFTYNYGLSLHETMA